MNEDGQISGTRLAIVGIVIAAIVVASVSTYFVTKGGEEKKKPVLQYWNTMSDTEQGMKMLREKLVPIVEKNVPEIRLKDYFGPGKYEKEKKQFLIAAKSGVPDVQEQVYAVYGTLVDQGLIMPITERFNNWDKSDEFYDWTIDAMKIKGEIWGVPHQTNVRCLAYRKDILEKYGLSVPKTWSELVEVASTITEKEEGMQGLALTTKQGDVRACQEFQAWFYAATDHRMFKRSGDKWTLWGTEEDFKKVFELYHAVLNADPPGFKKEGLGNGYPETDRGLLRGKYAMAHMGPWLPFWAQGKPENSVMKQTLDEIAVAPLPQPEGSTDVVGSYAETKAYVINKYTKHPDKTWELITEGLENPEWRTQVTLTNFQLPARKDIANKPKIMKHEWLKPWSTRVKEDRGIVPAPINWGPVKEEMYKNISAVCQEVKTPQKAASDFVTAVEQLVKKEEI
ncbi:hypothetical protein AKJ65_05580 [candidate division MSBL1 archaeon SCGC-AAA259E19]|uniref:ABC transporter substrate-binding protein n=1 Tax=candidate division MSBL1 archaeon SCGC-AAA259E19 TaxID=1698264 RepID=A0A133UIK4_9EURY|nr:hypothetical protein AKJ65_05580 [candidate division MSBL1 archaeon SCGC-AAA259E19]